MKKSKKTPTFSWIILIVSSFGLIAAIVGIVNAVYEISDQSIAKTPDAILASVDIDEGEQVSVPVLYYDQKADPCVSLYNISRRDALKTRQFEWSSCGYHIKKLEQGLAEYELDDNYLPVAVNGKFTPNKGLDFTRWYSAVDGKSTSYAGTISLRYTPSQSVFEYSADSFYPLDAAEFSASDSINGDGHNHLFTMNFAVPLMVLGSGDEAFEITADDDTFVFVGDKLVIDMGGIHDVITGRFVIHDNGEIYNSIGSEDFAYSGISLAKNENSIIRIFHADRDSDDSVFKVRFTGMNLAITSTELANGNDGIQVAYDPSDPTYIPPLGESIIFRPDSTKGFIAIITIESMLVIVASVLIVLAARPIVKRKIK